MECPFCAETIRNEALVCPRCARDLALVRPVIREMHEATVDIHALRRELDRLNLKLALRDQPGRFLLGSTSEFVVLPSAMLMGAHILLTFALDTAPIYLRIASILIPLPFGFVLCIKKHIGFRGAMLVGIATSALSIWGMLAITGYLDRVPVVPANWLEWKETLQYGLSIATAYGAGNLLGYLLSEVLPRSFTSSGNPGAAAKWLARAGGRYVGAAALRRRARLIEDIFRAALPLLGFLATVLGSVYSGLKGFLAP